MTPAECLKVLELGETASADEIKQAYRRHALHLHPDTNHDRHTTGKDFVRVAMAYRVLMGAIEATSNGHEVGLCSQCQQFGEITRSFDGQARCLRCALSNRRRYLPLPTIVLVKCGVTLALIALAVLFLLGAIQTDSQVLTVVAFFLGAASLAALAYTCLKVVHCLTRREAAQLKSGD